VIRISLDLYHRRVSDLKISNMPFNHFDKVKRYTSISTLTILYFIYQLIKSICGQLQSYYLFSLNNISFFITVFFSILFFPFVNVISKIGNILFFLSSLKSLMISNLLGDYLWIRISTSFHILNMHNRFPHLFSIFLCD
jgi:hypothetical protein